MIILRIVMLIEKKFYKKYEETIGIYEDFIKYF